MPDSPPSLAQRYAGYRFLIGMGVLAFAATVALLGGWGVTRVLPFFEVAAAALVVFLTQTAWYSRRAPTPQSVYVQMLLDVVLVSTLVAMTGGTTSLAAYLYFPSIVAAPFLLGDRSIGPLSLWTAGFSTVGLTSASLIGANTTTDSLQWVSDLIMRILAFFLVAMLIERYSRVAQDALEAEQQAAAKLAMEHSVVLQQVRAVVLSTDASGKVVMANPAAMELLGSPLGHPIAKLLPGMSLVDRWEEWRKDSVFACSRAALPSGGQVVVMDDITELYQMREQAAKDERFAAMGRLAAAVAHEIRNPLASLSGCLQLLTEDSQNRPARLALQEANRLNRLVDDFLHATSLPGLHREELDIAALAQEVVESVQLDPRINGRIQIKLSTRPVHARLDGDRLKQVLWNLLLNAAQAMPGGGDAEVRVGSQENGVQIQVLDSGKGVPEGDLERIFDPFYTTRAGGSGIGLAVVEQIVRVHGGTVKALPRNPQGTCISLWLPLEPQGVVNGH